MFFKRGGVIILCALISAPVMAHSIFLDCGTKEELVECKVSFSDGSKAENTPFEVISYDDELLIQGKTDTASSFSFNTPDQEYYILLDAGPGHVLELDMQDIE